VAKRAREKTVSVDGLYNDDAVFRKEQYVEHAKRYADSKNIGYNGMNIKFHKTFILILHKKN
jgi:hypothetical protein